MNTKTILWLEDETDQSDIMELTFKENGYNVIVVNTAEEALLLIETTVPDLFLVDIKLYGIDGIEFFRRIKSNEQFTTIPFIFLTAYNSLEMAIKAKHQGATDYITKPFDVDYLVDRIKEILPTE
jgi:DNA-binding response OmpR family regulator